jgi:hypothetical protein
MRCQDLLRYQGQNVQVRYRNPEGTAVTTFEGTLMDVATDPESGNSVIHVAALGRADRLRILPTQWLEQVIPKRNSDDRVSFTRMSAPGAPEITAQDRASAIPLSTPKESFVPHALRYGQNTVAMERNLARLRVALPLLAAKETDGALRQIYREHFQGLILNMAPDLYGAENPHSVANMQALRAKPLRFETPLWRRADGTVLTEEEVRDRRHVLAGDIIPPSPEHLEEVFNAFTSAMDLLTNHVAQRISSRDRRGYVRPEDARPAYALAAWGQRMVTMMQAGHDANTRAGRSFFEWVMHRVAYLAGGVTIPTIDISSQAVLNRLAVEHLAEDVRLFSPFAPQETDGDLKDNLTAHYRSEIEYFVRMSGGNASPHMLIAVRYLPRASDNEPLTPDYDAMPDAATLARFPSGRAVTLRRYFTATSAERRMSGFRTVRDFYLSLIDNVVENPVHVGIDPPSQAVAEFVVNFLNRRGSMGK